MPDKTPSDPSASPAGKPADVVHDAVRDDGRDQMPKAKPISFTQQIFIWALIIIVGGLFGMSGSMSVINSPQRRSGGISQGAINVRMNADRKLFKALGQRADVNEDQYVELIKVAEAAEDEGLMPSGKALDRLVDDFLSKPAPGQEGKTIKDALNEHKGGENEVTRDELRRHLSERAAYRAYYTRHLIAPAVPIAAAEAMTLVENDQVQAEEAEIDGSAMLPTIDANDPEIATTYDKLRASRFTKPESAILTVAYADMAAYRAKIQVTPEEIQAYYDEHKKDPDFQKPKPPDAKPEAPDAKPPADPKPLDDMKAVITERLVSERALAQAKAADEALNRAVEDKGLEGQKDNAAFIQAAKDAGFSVKENVQVSPYQAHDQMARMMAQYTGRPIPWMIRLGDLGTMHDPDLFKKDKEPGFISRELQADGPPTTWVMLRLESRKEAGYKSLDEVKPEVISYLQGQRGYTEFLKQAELARAAAEKLGAGGLAAYLASPDGAKWKAKPPTKATYKPAQVLRAPPSEPGQPSSDQRVAASLAMPDHPVALVAVADADPDEPSDVPKAKLVQATGYEAGKPATEVAARAASAEKYRQELERFRQQQLSADLQRIRDQK